MVGHNVLPQLPIMVLVLKEVLFNQVFCMLTSEVDQISISPKGQPSVEFNSPLLLWDHWPKLNSVIKQIERESDGDAQPGNWMQSFLREQWTIEYQQGEYQVLL